MEREVQRLIDAYQVSAINLAELQERRRRNAEHQQCCGSGWENSSTSARSVRKNSDSCRGWTVSVRAFAAP